jgi:aminopeptidase N
MKNIFTVLFSVLAFANAYTQKVSENESSVKCSHLNKQDGIKFSVATQPQNMNDYDVKFYWLDVAIERTSTYVSGNVSINATVQNNPLDTFVVELIDALIVDSTTINSVVQTAVHTGGLVKIPMGSSTPVGTDFSVKIYYHGTPVSSGFFAGMSNAASPSWGNTVTWSLSEPFNANQWWPCKQILEDKADSSWVFITTDPSNKAGSNGILSAVTSLPNGKARYEWKSRSPIAYYLISVSVAQYVDYTIYAHPAGTSDSVMIQNYVYNNPQALPHFKNDIDSTAQMIELYSKLYGMYPFIKEKYGHCMAPLSGGMEHQTMTTLGSFSFDLICHELGHMWWGDNVTCKSWSDIMINEGFASYSEYLSNQYLRSWNYAQTAMAQVHSSVMSATSGSIYIPTAETNDENRIFDSRLSYDKGSAVIHMMRFEVQDDTIFFNTLKNFQNIYGQSTAGVEEFKSVLEANSSLSFTDFWNQWIYGEGYPTYSLVWHQANDTLYFTSTQSTSSAVTPLFKMLMEYKLNSLSGDTLIRVYQTSNVNNFKISTHKAITGIAVDPNNWVLNKVGTITVGTEEIENPVHFMMAPNPCTNSLNVYFDNTRIDNFKIEIVDIYGRKISESLENSKNVTINTSQLAKGFYLLKVTGSGSTMVKRFVKD